MPGTDSPEKPVKCLDKYPVNVCPDLGTPEHYALGGGRGPVYESPRWMEELIKKEREKGIW